LVPIDGSFEILLNPMYKSEVRLWRLVIILFLGIWASCTLPRKHTVKLTNLEKSLADSLLAHALDHEALYTLADTLKPMSSIRLLRLGFAKDSNYVDGWSTVVTNDSLLRLAESYHRVCSALSKGDWLFLTIPFERTEKKIRNMEVYVIRRSVFARTMQRHASFFGQWGFTPSTAPATVVSVVEYERKLDRYRGYGYLFGYPDHAVDFFVEAARRQDMDSSHHLVARDFHAIPVFAAERGYFTYAVPKGHRTNLQDSVIRTKAMRTLDVYRRMRTKYQKNRGMPGRSLWSAMRRRTA